ncbi:NUDIX hydrolase [Ornithinimicrobium cavernae]|uniref:NUDIX hydrolase n=1 Tax=Ornithinimicrobium cavernae TaxID=2666047 RepID=UPI001F18B933|nr:NUDIX hydrolase [Ornithinimicrobium cavernae]
MSSTPTSDPALREVDPGVVELTWTDGTVPETTALLPLLDRAFADGARRVEARVRVGDRDTRVALQRAGLRPEGTARGRGTTEGGRPVDVTLLARLVDDPEPGSRDSFLAMLNATLPRTRVIAQGLVRDDRGRVLLCELTYKSDWDLPGGVVDPHESPRHALEREVAEELGLELRAGRLLAVNWLPPYRQWDDAVLFVFDLGTVPDLRERARLETSELAGVHWTAPEELGTHLAPYAVRHLTTVLTSDGGEGPLFLEDGLLVT